MVMLLGGRAGGLVPGQHLAVVDHHPVKVVNTAFQAIGVAAEMGEIPGYFSELFA